MMLSLWGQSRLFSRSCCTAISCHSLRLRESWSTAVRRWSPLPWIVEGKGHCSTVPPALGLTARTWKLGKGPGNAKSFWPIAEGFPCRPAPQPSPELLKMTYACSCNYPSPVCCSLGSALPCRLKGKELRCSRYTEWAAIAPLRLVRSVG